MLSLLDKTLFGFNCCGNFSAKLEALTSGFSHMISSFSINLGVSWEKVG